MSRRVDINVDTSTTSARTPRVRSQVRTQWLVLAAALIVLAGLLVAWALSRAVDRVQVVQVRSALSAGDVIGADDLALVGISSDASIAGLVPAGSLPSLVGRVAAVDLGAGSLLVAGMWADAPDLGLGEHGVGAVLKVGAYPAGLARGDHALAVSLDDAALPVTVRVIDVAATDADSLVVTLAVPSSGSVAIAQLAATDRLVLIGLPIDEAVG